MFQPCSHLTSYKRIKERLTTKMLLPKNEFIPLILGVWCQECFMMYVTWKNFLNFVTCAIMIGTNLNILAFSSQIIIRKMMSISVQLQCAILIFGGLFYYVGTLEFSLFFIKLTPKSLIPGKSSESFGWENYYYPLLSRSHTMNIIVYSLQVIIDLTMAVMR